MDRNIPHVLDIFSSSPGERRRIMFTEREHKGLTSLKDQQKNPGSDSAVCLCSSSDEDERNISKYFDYLDDDDLDDNPPNSKKKKNGKNSDKKVQEKDTDNRPIKKQESENKTIKKETAQSREDLEKDIKQIERHLSMKKTIRKKMMRDLQQAFVEDPKEYQQDPSSISPERKSNINIQNLTISKKRLSKSEHSFLDMLKENDMKDRKTSRGLGDSKSQKLVPKRTSRSSNSDNDSGNDSPTRESKKQNSVPTKPTPTPIKEEKKTFWQRLTGKGKAKR